MWKVKLNKYLPCLIKFQTSSFCRAERRGYYDHSLKWSFLSHKITLVRGGCTPENYTNTHIFHFSGDFSSRIALKVLLLYTPPQWRVSGRCCKIVGSVPHSSADFLLQSHTPKKPFLDGVFSELIFTTLIARAIRSQIDLGQFDHGEFSGVVRFCWNCFKNVLCGLPHNVCKISPSLSVISQQPQRLALLFRQFLL